MIQSADSLHLGRRALLRQVELLRTNLETQRRAVEIAIRRVDLTRAELYAPVPPSRTGQRVAQFGPTATITLEGALTALRDAQNAFLAVYLNYYATRIRLAREMGIMELDERGKWIERPLVGTDEIIEPTEGGDSAEELPMPPGIPPEWLGLVDQLERRLQPPLASMSPPVGATSMQSSGPDAMRMASGLPTEADSNHSPKEPVGTNGYNVESNRY